MPTKSWSIGCWPRRILASGWPCGGSIWSVTPIPPATTAITRSASRRIATTSSTRSTRTSRSTGSPSNSLRAICCRARRTEQHVASAYNRLLQTTEEGGAQAKEYEAKYSSDRVRNFGQVWLGGTIMCSECHNHKFDPYTQADFYSMAAFFADIQEPSVGSRGPGTPVPQNPADELQLKRNARALAIAQAKLEAAARVFAADPDAFADLENWPIAAFGRRGRRRWRQTFRPT